MHTHLEFYPNAWDFCKRCDFGQIYRLCSSLYVRVVCGDGLVVIVIQCTQKNANLQIVYAHGLKYLVKCVI